MNSRWEGIEELIAVIDEGSFSSAAKRLGISKAHVSQQISRLEDRLGTRLLHRTTRKVSVTETGAIYADRCRSILADLESTELAVSTLQNEVRGKLRISSPHLLGEVLLLPALTEFQRSHPMLEIDIDLTSRRIDLIDEHYDLAIQLGERKDVNVVNKTLTTTRFHVVASPEYINKHGSPQTLEELKQHHCLLFSSRGRVKPWKFRDGDNTLEVNIKSRWRSNSGHLLRAAAKQGIGLAYLPDYYLTEELKTGELVSLINDWQSIDRKVVAIYQHRAHVTSKIHLFLEFLTTFFEEKKIFLVDDRET